MARLKEGPTEITMTRSEWLHELICAADDLFGAAQTLGVDVEFNAGEDHRGSTFMELRLTYKEESHDESTE